MHTESAATVDVLEKWSSEHPVVCREELLAGPRCVRTTYGTQSGRCIADFGYRTANRLQLLILAVRPLLLEAVKTAIASAGFRGWAQRLDMPHRLEIEQSAKASRQNVHLCRQVLRLRQPATLSITNIHNSFNAALSLELYQILLTEDLTQDREDIAFTTALLRVNRENHCYAELSQEHTLAISILVTVYMSLKTSLVSCTQIVSFLQVKASSLGATACGGEGDCRC